jgi:hypothetical protein
MIVGFLIQTALTLRTDEPFLIDLTFLIACNLIAVAFMRASALCLNSARRVDDRRQP